MRAKTSRKRLWVQVVSARNLESRQAMDAYCVVQVVGAGAASTASNLRSMRKHSRGAMPHKDHISNSAAPGPSVGTSVSFASRSLSVQTSGTSALWSHAIDVELSAADVSEHSTIHSDSSTDSDDATDDVAAAALSSARVLVQIFNEKNFFFDMFPAAFSSSDCRNTVGAEDDHTAPVDAMPGVETDSDDDDDDDDSDTAQCAHVAPLKTPLDASRAAATARASLAAAAQAPPDAMGTTDESLGFVELFVAALTATSTQTQQAAATDAWYLLRGTRSGEVRIRTLCVDATELGDTADSAAARDVIFRDRVLNDSSNKRDRYGFQIPEHAQHEWSHLRSYDDCRELRRVSDWERAFGSSRAFVTLSSSCLHRLQTATKEKAKERSSSRIVQTLACAGIPRTWRERVYMHASGAYAKQQDAGADYYASLALQTEQTDTPTFRQIELDIDRTFGHSGTTICTDAGRHTLRRILRAYSIRNPAVGYCQGLNFIVGFLTLAVSEESAFWLLAVLCEDLFPGYYTPTMAETQTDMLVLKELIADELPELDAFTTDVGLPLELLGSQWLLCLFTTTFPSETVFRIFDCVFTDADSDGRGSRFVFPVILAHLRRLETTLLRLDDFQAVLSAMKDAENTLLDADSFLADAVREAEQLDAPRVLALREKHRVSVRDEMQRAARVRALNRQLAVVYQIPAFSSYAASLLRFFHEEAEVSSRADVAFILTLLCHGLVWLAEHSKRWQR